LRSFLSIAELISDPVGSSFIRRLRENAKFSAHSPTHTTEHQQPLPLDYHAGVEVFNTLPWTQSQVNDASDWECIVAILLSCSKVGAQGNILSASRLQNSCWLCRPPCLNKRCEFCSIPSNEQCWNCLNVTVHPHMNFLMTGVSLQNRDLTVRWNFKLTQYLCVILEIY